MSTETQVQPLSKLDLRALRDCDRVCLESRNGVSALRCIREVRNAGPFDARDREYMIHVDARVTDFGAKYSAAPLANYACFDLQWNYRNVPTSIGAIIASLRVGDALRLRWLRDCNSELVRDAGLHVDRVALEVTRKGRTLEFLVDAGVYRDNSARMVRLA